MALMALDVGPGDAVIVPAFTFRPPPEVVVLTGATPVFCDVRDDTFNLDADDLAAAVSVARALVFGRLASLPSTCSVSPPSTTRVDVAGDGRGAVGARRRRAEHGRRASVIDPVGSLGADRGHQLLPGQAARCVRRRRCHLHRRRRRWPTSCVRFGARQGCATSTTFVRIGLNGRLDTCRPPCCWPSSTIFDDEVERRQVVAAGYRDRLADVAVVPVIMDGYLSAWAQYTLVVSERDRVAKHLNAAGVPTAVYYPVPLHRQRPYAGFPRSAESLPVSDRLSAGVLSLPMHPYLTAATLDDIASAVTDCRGGNVVSTTSGTDVVVHPTAEVDAGAVDRSEHLDLELVEGT